MSQHDDALQKFLDAAGPVVEEAVRSDVIPGAVVGAEDANGRRAVRAWGLRAVVPRREPMTRGTLFDLASLTKALATAPAVMLTFRHLSTPLRAVLPQCKGWPIGDVPVLDLLRHTSGLPPYVGIDAIGDRSPEGVLDAIRRQTLHSPPGERVVYSCLNYILLGLAVQNVTGTNLDRLLRDAVWSPLGLRDIMFFPSRRGPDVTERCAPTTCGRDGDCLRGVVHDPLARIVESDGRTCSGNAGLFASVDALLDLSRELLNLWRGARSAGLPSTCGLRRRHVLRMWRPATAVGGEPVYGCGWRVWRAGDAYGLTDGNCPRRGRAVGHTGYTGTFLRIDRTRGTILAVLTNRVHPTDDGDVFPLRARLTRLFDASCVSPDA